MSSGSARLPRRAHPPPAAAANGAAVSSGSVVAKEGTDRAWRDAPAVAASGAAVAWCSAAAASRSAPAKSDAGGASPATAQLVRIPAPQAWLPQRTFSVSMVSASELRVCLQSQYGPSARTSSSSTGLRPVPPVRTDPVRIKYSPRGLRSRDHWFSSCVLWWAPDRAGDAQDWRRQRWHCWWVCGVGVSASFLLCSFFLVSFRGRSSGWLSCNG